MIDMSTCTNHTLTDKLYYEGFIFYLVGLTSDNERIYKSLDELRHYTIITAPADYDGVLIGTISDYYDPTEADDTIRYFDAITGIEEA